MISIIIPLYNKEAYVLKTLNSILQQTFTNFEVIVINDGSTDNSATIVKSVQDPRIRLIHIENSGVSVARNTGIGVARHDWIAFLDADDWWAPTFLEEIIVAINSFPNKKIFASGRSKVYEETQERYHNNVLPEDGATGLVNYFEVIAIDLPPINSSSLVVKKKLLNALGTFRKGMRQHEDHDLWIRLCAQHDIVFINKNLSFYQKNIANTASQNTYGALDFQRYMDTMCGVKKLLSKQNTKFFQQFTKKFIVLSFMIYASNYTASERNRILKSARKLISPSTFVFLKVFGQFSFLNLYGMYKKIKG